MKTLLGIIKETFTMGTFHVLVLDRDCSDKIPDISKPDVIHVKTSAGAEFKTTKRDSLFNNATDASNASIKVVALKVDKLSNISAAELVSAEVFVDNN